MIFSLTTGELQSQLSIFPNRLPGFIFFPRKHFFRIKSRTNIFPSAEGVPVPPINLQRESQLYSETKQRWITKHKGIKPLSCSSPPLSYSFPRERIEWGRSTGKPEHISAFTTSSLSFWLEYSNNEPHS